MIPKPGYIHSAPPSYSNQPGPPPRPGLIWKPSTHRWIKPLKGGEGGNSEDILNKISETIQPFYIERLIYSLKDKISSTKFDKIEEFYKDYGKSWSIKNKNPLIEKISSVLEKGNGDEESRELKESSEKDVPKDKIFEEDSGIDDEKYLKELENASDGKKSSSLQELFDAEKEYGVLAGKPKKEEIKKALIKESISVSPKTNLVLEKRPVHKRTGTFLQGFWIRRKEPEKIKESKVPDIEIKDGIINLSDYFDNEGDLSLETARKLIEKLKPIVDNSIKDVKIPDSSVNYDDDSVVEINYIDYMFMEMKNKFDFCMEIVNKKGDTREFSNMLKDMLFFIKDNKIQVIGSYFINKDRSEFYINSVVVHPSLHRKSNKGYGTKFMFELIKKFLDSGMDHLITMPLTFHTEKYYSKLGFVPFEDSLELLLDRKSAQNIIDKYGRYVSSDVVSKEFNDGGIAQEERHYQEDPLITKPKEKD